MFSRRYVIPVLAAIVIVVMRSYPAGLAGLIEGQLRRWRPRR